MRIEFRAGEPVRVETRLPAPIGSTSFRVKGHVYSKMLENVDATVQGGIAHLLERIEEPEVRTFLCQRFLAGGWYDALPLGPATRAHANLLGEPLHQASRKRGYLFATTDIAGIYRSLLRLFSAKTLVTRLPRAATLYFSFGEVTVDELRADGARLSVGNLPSSLAPMLAATIEGFVAGALDQSGAAQVRVRTLDVLYSGLVVDGLPTAAARIEATWAP